MQRSHWSTEFNFTSMRMEWLDVSCESWHTKWAVAAATVSETKELKKRDGAKRASSRPFLETGSSCASDLSAFLLSARRVGVVERARAARRLLGLSTSRPWRQHNVSLTPHTGALHTGYMRLRVLRGDGDSEGVDGG